MQNVIQGKTCSSYILAHDTKGTINKFKPAYIQLQPLHFFSHHVSFLFFLRENLDEQVKDYSRFSTLTVKASILFLCLIVDIKLF